MANIWWNKQKKRWCTDVTVGGRQERHYFSDKKEEAQQEFYRLMLDLGRDEHGNPVRRTYVTYEDVANEFLHEIKITRSMSTFRVHRDALSKFAREDDRQRPITGFGPRDLASFKERLILKGYAPKTINHFLASVRQLFSWAEDMDYIDGHKMHRVKNVPPAEREAPWLSGEEVQRLLDACPEDFRDMVVAYLNTGARPGELRKLTWSDVDLNRGYIAIRGSKTSRTVKDPRVRYVPISPPLRRILKKLGGGKPKDPVFRNPCGRPYTKDGIAQRFRRRADKAGLTDISTTTLRHTCASHLVQKGVSMEIVRQLLGHTDSRTTQIYAHLAPEHLKPAVDQLNFDWDGKDSGPSD